MMTRGKHQGPHKSNLNKIIISVLAAVILVLLAVIVVNQSRSKTDDADKTSVESSKASSSSSTKQATVQVHHATAGIGQLANFSQSAVEDPDTRTNGGDVTYSQFYLDSDNNWYWSFSSDKRGQIENARATSVKRDSADYVVQLISEKYESGTSYEAKIHWNNSDHTNYNFNTSFKSIDGDYTFGNDALSSYSSANDVSTSTSGNYYDWLKENVDGEAMEIPETRTNGGDVTGSHFEYYAGDWFWDLDSSKRGTVISAQIISGTVSHDGTFVTLTAQNMGYPDYNDEFTITINTAISNGDYNLKTNFQSVNGTYQF